MNLSSAWRAVYTTITNPAQRAAVANQILGRSFQELGPVILSIAENGLPRFHKKPPTHIEISAR